MENKLREELLKICGRVKTRRTPAIRRSLRKDYLYATDLPQTAEKQAVADFLRMVCKNGWKASEEDGWIQLDKPVPIPPPGWDSGMKGPEETCCLSILMRHAGRTDPSDGRTERQLVKAGETGAAAYEDTCRSIHAEWAERLRNGQKIPDVDPGFFGGEK